MEDNTYLSEKTLDEIEKNVNAKQLGKFNRSKLFNLWLKFYAEWFDLKNLDLKDVHILYQDGRKLPGMMMIFVPKDFNLSILFEKLKEKKLLETSIEKPEEQIKNLRTKVGAYVLHTKYRLTLLEELLVEAFHYYQKGEFLPYGHHLVGPYFVRSSNGFTFDGRHRVSIASESEDNKRTGLRVYMSKW